MKKIIILCLCTICFSCTSLPAIHTANSNGINSQCDRQVLPFARKKSQYIHTISAKLPTGDISIITGISVIDPVTGFLHSVLLSIEGIVLLDVTYDPGITINHAIPPFDRKAIAIGMVEDIRLLLLKPKGKVIGSGFTDRGECIYRYKLKEDSIIDIISYDNKTDLNLYDKKNSLMRSIKYSNVGEGKSAGKISLVAHGLFGYELDLELVEFEEIND